MSEKRMSARVMCYEEGSVAGKPMIATGALLRRETVPEGYHCYDVYAEESVFQTGRMTAFAGESGQAIGSVILAEPLDFGGKEEITLEEVKLYEEDPMINLKDFILKTEEQAQSGRPEKTLEPAQSM